MLETLTSVFVVCAIFFSAPYVSAHHMGLVFSEGPEHSDNIRNGTVLLLLAGVFTIAVIVTSTIIPHTQNESPKPVPSRTYTRNAV